MSEWKGPITFVLGYNREHTKTVRYDCEVEDRIFAYYVPKVLVHEAGYEWPERIFVEISASEMPRREIGFLGKEIKPRTGSNFWEYDLYDDSVVHSVRYCCDFEGASQSIYIPRKIFSHSDHPNRVLVYIGFIED